MNLLNKFVIFYFLVLPSTAIAQSDPDASQAGASKVSPCEEDPRFREFDFWVGQWDVHDVNGTFVGENSITREESGCVVIENWLGAKGSTGMSINYLDKVTNEWVQSWHAAGGYQIVMRGGLTDDGMLLNGTIHYIANGQTSPFRGLWTAMPDGRVRQYFEQSNDDFCA